MATRRRFRDRRDAAAPRPARTGRARELKRERPRSLRWSPPLRRSRAGPAASERSRRMPSPIPPRRYQRRVVSVRVTARDRDALAVEPGVRLEAMTGVEAGA